MTLFRVKLDPNYVVISHGAGILNTIGAGSKYIMAEVAINIIGMREIKSWYFIEIIYGM